MRIETKYAAEAVRLSEKLRALCIEAGVRIMEVYARDFSVTEKEDSSPLTEADLASHNIIIEGLSALEGPLGALPVLSEEGGIPDFKERVGWEAWWLIDPLDGTKEFVKRNGEFTVNIALIIRLKPGAAGIPLAGWVYTPVLDILYEGIFGSGAVRYDNIVTENANNPDPLPLPVEISPFPTSPPRIVASRSHRTPETDAVINSVAEKFGAGEIVSSGSSLKLCRIAEGTAELYPRAAPTMEWDTAAADAVCRAAGARVVETSGGMSLRYGKKNLLNPWFLVSRYQELLDASIEALRNPE